MRLDKLEALTGQSNFTRWRTTIKRVLKMKKLLDLTVSKQPEPTEADEKLSFELKNIEAVLIMQQLIATDLQWVIQECNTAHEAWTSLHAKYEPSNTITSIYQFKAAMQLVKDDSETMNDFSNRFGVTWSEALNKFSNTNDTLGKSLKPFFESDIIKAGCLLIALPSTYDSIIDNIQTKDTYKYDEIMATLLSLKSSNADSAKALAAINKRSGNNNRGGGSNSSYRKQQNPTGVGKTQPPGKGDCSWCKKHGFPYTGHVHYQCHRLKEHQQQQNNQVDKGKASIAFESAIESGVGLIAHQVSLYPTNSQTGSQTGSALLSHNTDIHQFHA